MAQIIMDHGDSGCFGTKWAPPGVNAGAGANGIASPAFPSISTGIYGYPVELAAEVAVTTLRESLKRLGTIREVVFCCFSASDLAIYEESLAAQEKKD